MAIEVSKALDIGENGQFISDDSTGAEIFWTGAGVSVPAFDLPCPGRYFRSNGLIYFNSTGNNANWVQESSSTDHHAGFNFISSGQTINIDENKQMIVKGKITLEGKVNICGDLILF